MHFSIKILYFNITGRLRLLVKKRKYYMLMSYLIRKKKKKKKNLDQQRLSKSRAWSALDIMSVRWLSSA